MKLIAFVLQSLLFDLYNLFLFKILSNRTAFKINCTLVTPTLIKYIELFSPQDIAAIRPVGRSVRSGQPTPESSYSHVSLYLTLQW
jgi:hypothetical protein